MPNKREDKAAGLAAPNTHIVLRSYEPRVAHATLRRQIASSRVIGNLSSAEEGALVYKLLVFLVAALACAWGGEAHAAWHEARSKHFIIYADLSPKELRAFAEKLERFDQAVRYVRGMQDPELTDAGRIKLYVLRSDAAVEQLIGQENARGMYLSRASGSYAFVPRMENLTSIQGASGGLDTSKNSFTTQVVFFHEYAHHLQLQDASVALPTWAVEGFAEFFATAEVKKDGSVTIGKFPAFRAGTLSGPRVIPIDEMVGGANRKLSQEENESLYGRAWLLTHYLAVDGSRKGQFSRYVEGIQKGIRPLESAKAAFGDLQALDQELRLYIGQRQLLGFTVDSRVIPIGRIALRPLSPGRAAIMDVHIRSKRGVDEGAAAALATEARKIASRHPQDPFVQTTLAETEYDTRNYVAAEAAADRALAADPRDLQALIYKGRARMAIARANPTGANWDEIRTWFIKANKVDTEHAEPLLLFYRSYAEAGQRPNRNAVEALLYAVDLAPRDEEVRLNAVRQLLIDSRFAEATKMFAPLAFQPHLSAEQRERNAGIGAAIAARDTAAALRLIDAPG